jgi:hypothetical protein
VRKDFYERAVAIEHRRLDALFEEVLGALREGRPLEVIRAAFANLGDTLVAHVKQEDRIYYPAVAKLHPQHQVVLNGLVEVHRDFRRRLSAIDKQLTGADVVAAERALGEFAGDFAKHEAVEEQLLRSIQEEFSAEA